MNLTTRLTILFILLFSINSFAANIGGFNGADLGPDLERSRGGWSSGGGTLISKDGKDQYMLIDLFKNDKNFEDDFKNGTKLPTISYKRELFKYNKSVFNWSKIRKVNIKLLSSPYKFLQDRLDLWRNGLKKQEEKIVIRMIRESIENSHFYYTSKSPEKYKYQLPEWVKEEYPKSKTIRVATFNHVANFGVLLFKENWDKAGKISQAGTILHEGMRQIQISYGDGMSEEDLEKVTAKIIMEEPNGNDKLSVYFGNFIGDLVRNTDNKYRTDLINLCDKLQAKYGEINECQKRTVSIYNDAFSVLKRIEEIPFQKLPDSLTTEQVLEFRNKNYKLIALKDEMADILISIPTTSFSYTIPKIINSLRNLNEIHFWYNVNY